jgi:predicted nucleic acid-binding protein
LLLVDTSVLLAAADAADSNHDRCVLAIDGESLLVTTAFVIAETACIRSAGNSARRLRPRSPGCRRAGEIRIERHTHRRSGRGWRSVDARLTVLPTAWNEPDERGTVRVAVDMVVCS